MHRVPNKASFEVVYFQHGVLDNAIAWVVHGRDGSAGYLAHLLGFDVFLGNCRGIYPRKVAAWRDKSLSYWNYSIDHLAKYDITAFIETILKIKTEELKQHCDLPEDEITKRI